MNILTIDPGTKCGFASLINGMVESGTADFSVRRGESKGMLYYKFTRWLREMLEGGPFDMVVYEMPYPIGVAAKEIAYGITTRIQELCTYLKIEYTLIHPSQLKRWATGKGRVSKEVMTAEAKKRYPDLTIEGHDQADALLILSYAIENFNSKEVNHGTRKNKSCGASG